MVAIGFDFNLTRAPITGIGRYGLALLHAVRAAADREVAFKRYKRGRWLAVDEATLAADLDDAPPPEDPAAAGGARPRAREAALRLFEALPPLQTAWGRFARGRFARSLAGRPVDLYYALNFRPPAVVPGLPFVCVVHDLAFVRHPGTLPASRLRWLEGLGGDLRQAAAVQAVSQFTAGEMAAVFGLAPETIEVVHPIVDAALFEPAPDPSALLDRLGLVRGRYILSVGTREPRKNLATLVEAFAALPEALRGACPLVLVGPRGWGDSAWEQRHAGLLAAGQVRTLGYLPRAELRSLYGACALMAYGSLYEGFGIPVAEASACGAPLAISDCPALMEAAGPGEHVAVHEALDVAAWARTFRRHAEAPPRLAPLAERVAAARRFEAPVQGEKAWRLLQKAMALG